MPITYTIEATCDQCGAQIEPQTQVKVTSLKWTLWEWKRKWKSQGVMLGLPSRFGKYKIYCQKCSGS